jgi:hypothetical protein
MSNEKGYCSSCFQYTKHKLVKQNYARRNLYQCTNCKSNTLQCRACKNFTRSGKTWDDELCAEHSGLIANFNNLNKTLDDIETYKEIFERNSINIKKVGTIVAATVGGVAMITPLAFAAAPAIGGAIGTTVFSLSGAAATSAGLAALGGGALTAGGLGIVGGVAVIGAVGAGLGGTLGGIVSNSYFGDIKDFDIKKIQDGKGPSILFIDGFLTQKNKDTNEWEAQLRKLYPENPWYHITWESKRLLDLGKNIGAGIGKEAILTALKELAKKATKEGSKKLGPLAPVLTAFGIANNPWSVALIKAEQTGVLLADILARTDKKYILCGHSLGARVIYRTLDSLATKDKNFILDAHLLGGAIGSDKKSWTKAKKAVIGSIVNYRSDNDYVLATMYKLGTFFQSDPIGRHKIDVNGIIDVDVSDTVDGHTKYKNNFSNIFYETKTTLNKNSNSHENHNTHISIPKIIVLGTILLFSILYFLYALFSSSSLNEKINYLSTEKLVFQEIHFNKYLIYGNVFESKNESKSKFSRQMIVYIQGKADVKIDFNDFKIDKTKGIATYYTEDINSPFDIKVNIPEKNIAIVDNIYPKAIDRAEATLIAGVLGLSGASIVARTMLKNNIIPFSRLNNIQSTAIGSTIAGTMGIALGMNTKGISFVEGLGAKEKDEIVVKAEKLLLTSLKYDKKLVTMYKKKFEEIIIARALQLGIKINEVNYVKK